MGMATGRPLVEYLLMLLCIVCHSNEHGSDGLALAAQPAKTVHGVSIFAMTASLYRSCRFWPTRGKQS